MNSLFESYQEKNRSVTLNCFSPPVILFTFSIEALLAIYTWWKYRATKLGKRSTIFLLLLALFQISEWFICKGAPMVLWSRIGFDATAFLPILGIDFVSILAKKKEPMWLGYLLACTFALFYTFLPNAFTGAACTGQFVAFQGASPNLDFWYGAYYTITLALGIFMILRALKTKQVNEQAIIWLLIGYLVLILPTLTVYVLSIVSHSGVASILCGFAVLLAFVLVGKVLPEAHKNLKPNV